VDLVGLQETKKSAVSHATLNMISNYASFGILCQHKALLLWILVAFRDSSFEVISHVSKQFFWAMLLEVSITKDSDK
jgi:hypothetical protein